MARPHSLRFDPTAMAVATVRCSAEALATYGPLMRVAAPDRARG